MREKRLDQEEILAEFQKSIDELRKNNERFYLREKNIDKELKQTEAEIQVSFCVCFCMCLFKNLDVQFIFFLKAFQTEKQRELNSIDVTVTLKLSQIACLITDSTDEEPSPIAEIENTEIKDENLNGSQTEKNELEFIPRHLPSSLQSCLVFSSQVLEKLQERIKSLGTEKRLLIRDFKDLHKEKVRLESDKAKLQAEIQQLKERCTDVQMLKFGQIVDLDVLEKAGESKVFIYEENKDDCNHTLLFRFLLFSKFHSHNLSLYSF